MTPVILVVDDDREIRRLLIDIFRGEGYRVLGACDGSAALSMIENGPAPDLVVTDVVMPHMTGPQLQAHCRQRTLRTPFIMMSAMARPQMDPQTHFIQKPFDIQHLLDHVERILPPERTAQPFEGEFRTAAL